MNSAPSLEARTSGPAPEPPVTAPGTRFAGIDDATAERFRRDGVVHLEGAFVDWVDVLRAGVERNMRSPAPTRRSTSPRARRLLLR